MLEYSFVRHEDNGKKSVYNLFTKDRTEANLVRIRIIKLDTYRVTYMCFDENSSILLDEEISQRIGICPIIQDEFIKVLIPRNEEGDSQRFPFDFSTRDQPGWFTTDDILGVPFFKTHKLTYLEKDSRINGYIELKLGNSESHCGHMPTSIATSIYNEEVEAFEISFTNIGMFDSDTIMKIAVSSVEEEIRKENSNIFTKIIVSEDIRKKYM